MLPRGTAQGSLHVQQLCSNTLRVRRPQLGLHRPTPLTRRQTVRGPQSSFRGEPQEQQSASFRDNAQEKAQAVSKEASKRYDEAVSESQKCSSHLSRPQIVSYNACRVKATFQSVSAGVKKRAGQVNQRFDLSGKAQQTADRY